MPAGPPGVQTGLTPKLPPDPLSRCTPPQPQRLVGKPSGTPGPGISPSRTHPRTRASLAPGASCRLRQQHEVRSHQWGMRRCPRPPAQPWPSGIPTCSRGAAQHRVGTHIRAHPHMSWTQTLALPTQSRPGPDTAHGTPQHTRRTDGGHSSWGAGAWGAGPPPRPPICALTSLS